MGVGKSTISKRLSRHLYCKVIDLDRFIESKEGISIEEMFESKGEIYFREKEEYYLNRLLAENGEKVLVLSLGGGTLISKVNQELIKEKTFCIYLKASEETQIERLSKSNRLRPNIKEFKELPTGEYEAGIKRLFEIRRAGYEYCSSLIIDVDNKSVNDMLTEIINSI